MKTNFDVITESPEKLADYLFGLTADYLDSDSPIYSEEALEWLTAEAREDT